MPRIGKRTHTAPLTVGLLVAWMVVGLATPALAADTLTVDPPSGPYDTARTLTASGDFVDDHFAGPGYFHILIDGRTTTPFCEKKTNLISQTRWVECPIPGQGYDPGWHVVRLVRNIAGSDTLGPTTSYLVEAPPTTTTQPATTTTTQVLVATSAPSATSTSTGAATTAPESGPEETATTLAQESTTTTQIASTTTEHSTSTTAGPLAAEEDGGGSGGPGWLVLGLVAALAVAITVIVMQNLEHTRNRGS